MILASCGTPSGGSTQKSPSSSPNAATDIADRSFVERREPTADALVVRFADDRGTPLSGRSIAVSHVVPLPDGRRIWTGLDGAPHALDEKGSLQLSTRDDWKGEVEISLLDRDLRGHASPRGTYRIEWDGRPSELALTIPRLAAIEGRVLTPLPNHGVELSISNACTTWYRTEAGVTYMGFGPNSRALDLDETGRFALDDISPGTFELAVERGEARATMPIAIAPGQTLSIPDLDLDAAGGWIVGALEQETGEPLRGAQILATEMGNWDPVTLRWPGQIEVDSADDGRFRLGVVSDAVDRVRILAPPEVVRWPFRTAPFRPVIRETFVGSRSEGTVDLGRMRVPPACVLGGKVVGHDARHERLEIVHTSRDGTRRTPAVTLADGRFAVIALGSGTHELTVMGSRGYRWALGPFRHRLGEGAATERIVLEPPATGLDLQLPARATEPWRVSVYRIDEQEPFYDLFLSRRRLRGEDPVANPPGRIDGLDPGSYVVLARTRDGRIRSIETVEVAAGKRSGARFPDDDVTPLPLSPRLADASDRGEARIEVRSAAVGATLGPYEGTPGEAHVLVMTGDRVEIVTIELPAARAGQLDVPATRAISVELCPTVDGRPVPLRPRLVHERGFRFEPVEDASVDGADATEWAFALPEGRFAVEVDGRLVDSTIIVARDGERRFEVDVRE